MLEYGVNLVHWVEESNEDQYLRYPSISILGRGYLPVHIPPMRCSSDLILAVNSLELSFIADKASRVCLISGTVEIATGDTIVGKAGFSRDIERKFVANLLIRHQNDI